MKKISIISTTRRPQKYREFVEHIEAELGEFIESYISFVNDYRLRDEYKIIESQFSKVKIIYAPDNFLFKNGFDRVYNMLLKQVKTDYAWMLFDVDKVEVKDKKKFSDALSGFYNYIGIQTHMQRGDSLEIKYQLYKPDLLRWEGAVHENQVFLGDVKQIDLSPDIISIKHLNVVDSESSKLNKTDDGFIILEKTEEGTDSDKRNLLYESLAYRIVHENLPHRYRGWFLRHYFINKRIIDWYYSRAVKLWGKS